MPQVWDRDVLALGCGSGGWSSWLAESGARVVAVDLSENQLERDCDGIGDPRPRLRVVRADGEALPFRRRSFDIVFSHRGAARWGNPRAVVPQLARVLRPGGHLVFNVSTPWPQGSHLSYGEWVRILGAHDLVVEDPIELQGARRLHGNISRARKRKATPVAPGELVIRQCAAADVRVLDRHMRSGEAHRRRFAEQERGDASYVIAWIRDRPVGHLNLRWCGFDDPAVRVFAPCPELSSIGVTVAMRNRGIGEMLVRHAEGLIRERGFALAALDVELPNTSAMRLYERLGYVDWGRGSVNGSWTQLGDDGEPILYHTVLTVMTKRLE